MIYVVKHKPYTLPQLPEGYRPICVGRYSEPDAIDCSVGDNIEQLNIKLNELTAFYWLWKNTDDPIIGVDHYRAYLTNHNKQILTMPEINDTLRNHDAICCEFGIASHIGINATLSGVRGGPAAFDIVRRGMPVEYHDAFDTVMGGNRFYIANLIITRREIFDAYCSWLFSFIIDAAKEYRPQPGYSFQERRAVGYIAETLLTVWLTHNNISVAKSSMLTLGYDST